VLARPRGGDVLTHCFRPFPNAPVKENGQKVCGAQVPSLSESRPC
jgi:predicted amidohydrolase